jgi:uncharacterized protein (TIRG00374 family)
MSDLVRRVQAFMHAVRRTRALPTLIGLTLIVVLLVVSHPARTWSAIQQSAPWSLAVALAVNIPIVFLRTLRTDVILRRWDFHVPMRTLLPIQLIGQTSSTLTPAASGDYVRAYMWRSSSDVPVRIGAAVVTFERLYSLGLMIVLAVLLITLPRHGVIGWVGVAIGLALATLAPVALEQVPPYLERRLVAAVTRGPLRRFATGATEAVDNFRLILRSPVVLIQSSAITLAVYALSGAQVWLVLAGLDHKVPITQAVAAFAASQAVGILSTLPFGLGATDAVIVALLAAYGVTVATAAAVAVLLRATTTFPQAVAGLFAYMLLHPERDKRQTEEATTT